MKRLFVLRSNSLSTLSVAPPTRPVLSSPLRLPTEAPKQSQHSQLALSQPPAIQPPLFPACPPNSPAPSPVFAAPASAAQDSPRAAKRQRLQYQLDVGAYGIPKHRPFHTSSTSPYPHSSHSVQVGEDAYFLRDNAMGIADGVGGWSRSVPHSPSHPSPSALFSRRLMHFCAAEIDAIHAPPPSSAPQPFPFSFQHHLKPRPPPPLQDLEDSLEELSEGINVLNILQRAYDSTVRSHTPLTTGSSTALLAVLDHPPSGGLVPLPQSPEAPGRNYAAGSLYTPDPVLEPLDPPEPEPYDAVVRIAHLGDCMGMLVRADDIVWRSDEMWWGYNHPLQLGPPSSSAEGPTPLPVQPHTFTLPVRKDDILILASDGLSDNLWDEDVLDEVRKFRSASSWGSDPDTPSSSSILRRKAFAGLLSEALCSRAKRVSDTRPPRGSRSPSPKPQPQFSVIAEEVSLVTSDDLEVPFARRAKLAGRAFRGGKHDDISVIVAVISPSPSPSPSSSPSPPSSPSPSPLKQQQTDTL